MRIVEEMDLDEFEAWGGAPEVLRKLSDLDLMDWAEMYLEGETWTATQVNDFLWFDIPELYEEEFGKDLFD